MNDKIRFEIIKLEGDKPNQKRDGVAVLRNDKQVAVIPEADRLRRALKLPLSEIEHISKHLDEIMHREPTQDEEEFWKAVFEYKRQSS